MSNIITSVNNPRVKELLEILKNQRKESERLYLVEGKHLVEMAKDKKVLIEVFSLEPYDFVNNTLVSDNVIKKLTATATPQGVIGLCRKRNEQIDYSKPFIFLESVQDPGNVGAILRSACAFNYLQIILNEDCAALYNPKTLLASQGAYLDLEICYLSTLDVINFTRARDYQIITTELDEKATKLKNIVNLPQKSIIVFGNEGKGVSKRISKHKDNSIFVEIDKMDSLNVSVCAGIILYELKDRFI